MTSRITADFVTYMPNYHEKSFIAVHYPILWIDKRMRVIDTTPFLNAGNAEERAWVEALALAMETGAIAMRFHSQTDRTLFWTSL